MVRRRIEDLTAADFPGADPAKFQEWKLQLQKYRLGLIGCGIAIWACIFLQFVVRGMLWVFLFAAVLAGCLIYIVPILRRAAALRKELAIDPAALKRALSGN